MRDQAFLLDKDYSFLHTRLQPSAQFSHHAYALPHNVWGNDSGHSCWIIAVLRNLKGHEEWILRHIHLETNKYYCQQKWNVVCWSDLSVARMKLLFLGKIRMIMNHTVYSKDKFLKRYIAIEFFHSIRDPVCKRRMLDLMLLRWTSIM